MSRFARTGRCVLPAQTEEREMAEILLNKIWKRYPDGFEAVKELDLAIGDGEFMILVGPSGCGKSTALRMVAGLEGITQGELLIGGRRVNEVAPRDRDIAMVFQNYALYPHMTVRENMGFALKLAKVSKAEIDRKVSEAADVLELGPHLDRRPGQLSGGQRQRVAMGRAIVRDPKAFLMDEPLSNLDAKLRVQMRTQVSMLQRQLGTTMVYVTHDQTEALTFADKVVVMLEGEVVQVGTPQQLFEEPAHTFVGYFIGSPGMNVLPAIVDGATAHIGDSAIQLPRGYPPFAKDQKVEIGIRPEFLRIGTDDRGLKVNVLRVEDAGSRRIVRGELGGLPITAIASEDESVAAGRLSFEPDPARVHVYVDSKLVRV
jgi:multiple sugar transport system ATP-binding protein